MGLGSVLKKVLGAILLFYGGVNVVRGGLILAVGIVVANPLVMGLGTGVFIVGFALAWLGWKLVKGR